MSTWLFRTLFGLALPVWVVACDDTKSPASTDLPDAGFVSADVCPALDTACTTKTVPSFKKQVGPIIEKSCASAAGCHTGKPDDPWPLTDYQEIVDWKSAFVDDLRGCTMPPADAGVALSVNDRLVLWQWLTCGTPNN
jgi:hypothetical protein